MGVSADSIKGPVRGAVLSTLVILAATLLLVAVVASYFAERLAQRVRKLAVAADQISLGGLDEKIEPGSLDEIGDLAQAVDRMRFSLESAMRRMRRS
jgi:HAMP domain-containing protein